MVQFDVLPACLSRSPRLLLLCTLVACRVEPAPAPSSPTCPDGFVEVDGQGCSPNVVECEEGLVLDADGGCTPPPIECPEGFVVDADGAGCSGPTPALSLASADGRVSLAVPAGTTLGAEPSISEAPRPELEPQEVAVSLSYEVALHTQDPVLSLEGMTATLAFFDGVPPEHRDGIHVYAQAFEPNSAAAVSLTGNVDPANPLELVIELHGLAPTTILTVVYNPNQTSLVSEPGASGFGGPGGVAPWPTTRWRIDYDPTAPFLKLAVERAIVEFNATLSPLLVAAGESTTVEANLTTPGQVAVVVRQLVARNLEFASLTYQLQGYRAPNMARERCSFTPDSLVSNDRCYVAKFKNDINSAVSPEDTNALQRFFADGNPYCTFLIGALTLPNTAAGNDLTGSVVDSVFHELLHAIQAGYRWNPFSKPTMGFAEATAYHSGVSNDRCRSPCPHVQSNTGVMEHKLNYPLGYIFIPPPNERGAPEFSYRQQDFFAWVALKYMNGNSVALLRGFFEQLDSVGAVAVQSGDAAPPAVLQALDAAVSATTSFDLPTVYSEYALDRLAVHEIKLRPDATYDPPRTRDSIPDYANRFSVNETDFSFGEYPPFFMDVGYGPAPIQTVLVNPAGAPSTGTFSAILPFSARVLNIRPSAVAAGITARLALTSSTGELGSAVRATLVRRVGSTIVPIETPTAMDDWGSTTDDHLTVVITNVSLENVVPDVAFGIDFPALVVTDPTRNVVEEGGGAATLTVALAAPPLADVSVPVASTDETEGSASPPVLLFTPDNWNLPQTVTITWADDSEVDGAQNFQLELGPSTSVGDSTSANLVGPALTFTANDNDNDPDACGGCRAGVQQCVVCANFATCLAVTDLPFACCDEADGGGGCSFGRTCSPCGCLGPNDTCCQAANRNLLCGLDQQCEVCDGQPFCPQAGLSYSCCLGSPCDSSAVCLDDCGSGSGCRACNPADNVPMCCNDTVLCAEPGASCP